MDISRVEEETEIPDSNKVPLVSNP